MDRNQLELLLQVLRSWYPLRSERFSAGAAAIYLLTDRYGAATRQSIRDVGVNFNTVYDYLYPRAQRFGIPIAPQIRAGRESNALGHAYGAAIVAYLAGPEAAAELGVLLEAGENALLYQNGNGPRYNLYGRSDAERAYHHQVEVTADLLNNLVGSIVGDWARRNGIQAKELPSILREVFESGRAFVIRDSDDSLPSHANKARIALDIVSILPQTAGGIVSGISDAYLSELYNSGQWQRWIGTYGRSATETERLVTSLKINGWGEAARSLLSVVPDGAFSPNDWEFNQKELEAGFIRLTFAGRDALLAKESLAAPDGVVVEGVPIALKRSVNGQVSTVQAIGKIEIIGGRVKSSIFDPTFLVSRFVDDKPGFVAPESSYFGDERAIKINSSGPQQTVFISGIASNFGSTLGRQLAGDNLLLSTLTGSLLGTIAFNVGEQIEAGINGTLTSITLPDGTLKEIKAEGSAVWANFANELQEFTANAAIGSVSSWLALELGEKLGLEGFGAEMFSTGVGALLEHTLTDLAQDAGLLHSVKPQAAWFGPKGLTTAGSSALVSSFVSFFATKLGSLVVQPQTQAAAILSSLGSAAGSLGGPVGGYIGSAISSIGGSIFGKGVGSFLTHAFKLIPGVGIFIGFILGAFIGNLFGRKKPKIPTANAEVSLQIPQAEYALTGIYTANGGNRDLVKAMGEAARDTLNGLIQVVARGDDEARVSNTTTIVTSYGHTGGQLWVRLGGRPTAVRCAA